LTISGDRLRDHTTILFDFEQQVFQVNTPIKPGVKKKLDGQSDWMIEHTYMLNGRHSNVHVHMFLHVMLRIT